MPSSLSFPFTPLLLVLLTAAAAVPSPPSPLVHDICNQTSSPSLCVEAFSADPQTATTTNETTMVGTAVRLVGNTSGSTYIYISDLTNQPVGRAGQKRLHICEMCYLSVSYDMLLLSSALSDKSYGALASQAAEVAAQARRCDAAFSKSTWQPMGNRNKVLVVLCEAIRVLCRSIGH
ncbi:unnamed protein product [Linum tenue]|uniref:Pectinesterase inhibitor domain-containing protein n=1 Tax=Linum tenue TaxID=586396 RepID=A0AAV0H0Z4_9ROSI|nr:unnamed protein product [Linum tenue]